MPFYVVLKDGREGAVEGDWVKLRRLLNQPEMKVEDVVSAVIESTFGPIEEMWTIPYPCHQRLLVRYWPFSDGTFQPCPPFCSDPKGQCKGRGSCPKDYACSE